MSSSVRSWRQMVTDADPDFMKESLRPIVYEFSNGRKFRDRYPLWPNYASLDGEVLTIDGERVTI